MIPVPALFAESRESYIVVWPLGPALHATPLVTLSLALAVASFEQVIMSVSNL